MTVEAIRLQNFMAFVDTGWIELRPICLLFGRNSSGKSVIIRAMRLLRQSLTCGPEEGPLVFSSEDGIDLGSFREAVHHSGALSHCLPPIIFHFRCRLTDTLDSLREAINRRRVAEGQAQIPASTRPAMTELKLTFELNPDTGQVELTAFCIDGPWSVAESQLERTVLLAQRIEPDLSSLMGGDWVFESDILRGHELDSENPTWRNVSVTLESGFLPTLGSSAGDATQDASFQDFRLLTKVLIELRQSIVTFLQGIRHVGPLRLEPRRFYILDQAVQTSLDGSLALVDFHLGNADYKDFQELDHWLRCLKIGTGNEVRRESAADGRLTVSQIYLQEDTTRGRLVVNMADVGFGASQVLPVLIEALLANPGSLVIIEQPELHLHPDAQATLADFFIDCAAQKDIRFVLETHSEHLLLRFQRRIAETTYEDRVRANPKIRTDGAVSNQGHSAKATDVGLAFFQRADGRSQVESIAIDDKGQLVKPSEDFKDFFKQDYEDVVCLTDATAKIAALGPKRDRRG